MNASTSLTIRMVLTLFALLALSAFALAAVTGFFALVAVLGDLPLVVAPLLTLAFVGGVALWEWYTGLSLLNQLVAYEVGPERAPRPHRILARLASQVGIPTPTVAFVDTDEPLALTTGLRRSNATVVVSRGILERLSDDELTAVLAHEVAHVANRDASVMTFALAPVTLADNVQSITAGRVSGSRRSVVTVLIYYLSTGFELVARITMGHLSRAREFAADRGSVAITGDAASLVSALDTLSGETRPKTDLRRRTDVSALSIVSADRRGATADFGGWTRGYFGNVFRRFEDLTRTHPPVEERRRRLLALDPDATRADERSERRA